MNDFEKFSYKNVIIDKKFADKQMMLTFNFIWWELFNQYLHDNGFKLENLKIAEVGCGSGVRSLMLALLGAESTLIDIDDEALQVAKNIFELYGCKATFVKASVLDEPDKELAGKFDYVSSGGLVEHFKGQDRVRAMAFHRKLLNENGFAMVSSPNLSGPLYWIHRIFSTLCGTWDIKNEVPFSNWELKKTGVEAGFTKTKVLRMAAFRQDLLAYGYALGALMLKFVPRKINNIIKKSALYVKARNYEAAVEADRPNIKEYLTNRFEAMPKKTGRSLNDFFGANIIFLGRNK